MCVHAHVWGGEAGTEGRTAAPAVSLVRGRDLLRGSCPRLRPPHCRTPGFQVRRQRDRAGDTV